MATVVKPQAVSGVSAGVENDIETSYPSISASAFGSLLGRIMDSFPLQIGGIRLSHCVFAPIVIPPALMGYFSFKVFGQKYVLTNRSMQIRGNLSNDLQKQVALTDIDNIDVSITPGQEFYHAGNLEILDSRGETLLVLPGVTYPKRLRQIILDARDARMQNDAALKTIEARA